MHNYVVSFEEILDTTAILELHVLYIYIVYTQQGSTQEFFAGWGGGGTFFGTV